MLDYSCLCTRIRHVSAGAVGHAARIIVLVKMGSARLYGIPYGASKYSTEKKVGTRIHCTNSVYTDARQWEFSSWKNWKYTRFLALFEWTCMYLNPRELKWIGVKLNRVSFPSTLTYVDRNRYTCIQTRTLLGFCTSSFADCITLSTIHVLQKSMAPSPPFKKDLP
jgi:hypothetical protein